MAYTERMTLTSEEAALIQKKRLEEAGIKQKAREAQVMNQGFCTCGKSMWRAVWWDTSRQCIQCGKFWYRFKCWTGERWVEKIPDHLVTAAYAEVAPQYGGISREEMKERGIAKGINSEYVKELANEDEGRCGGCEQLEDDCECEVDD